MPYYQRRDGGSCRVMGAMYGNKLAIGDGLPTTMPPVATMNPAGRYFEVRLQDYRGPGGAPAYNAVVQVPFDLPGWEKPDYSERAQFSPWAELHVQVDPSDYKVKLYMGSWSGDGHDVNSIVVFRTGIIFYP
jgi:hypothetical protein